MRKRGFRIAAGNFLPAMYVVTIMQKSFTYCTCLHLCVCSYSIARLIAGSGGRFEQFIVNGAISSNETKPRPAILRHPHSRARRTGRALPNRSSRA